MDREKIMQQWDYWRGEIANGHKGSAPRDWFESVLDLCDEEHDTDYQNYLLELNERKNR